MSEEIIRLLKLQVQRRVGKTRDKDLVTFTDISSPAAPSVRCN